MRSRAERRAKAKAIIAKRKKQLETIGGHAKYDNYLAKTNGLTCGDSNCSMCGNPRKFFGEPTLQEKKFDQKDLY